jgi:hypothetical protein
MMPKNAIAFVLLLAVFSMVLMGCAAQTVALVIEQLNPGAVFSGSYSIIRP